jgi:DNA-binding MarR family transcriptional regulator
MSTSGGPASGAAPHDRQPRSSAAEHDPVEWMRQRWLEWDAPLPDYFAAMASLLRTSILLTDELDRILREHQLSRTAYLILITLQMSDRETRPLGQLSRALLVHPTTVTLAVDQLAKSRLVRRMPHPSDRRTILAKLTPAGQAAAVAASFALADACYGLSGLSGNAARRLTADLGAVRSGLRGQAGVRRGQAGPSRK